jgi:hypothetical protein
VGSFLEEESSPGIDSTVREDAPISGELKFKVGERKGDLTFVRID